MGAHLFKLRVRIDVHITDVTAKGFVPEAAGRLLDLAAAADSGEGLDGAVAALGLQHGLVLGASTRTS